jgi:hypothetical protein
MRAAILAGALLVSVPVVAQQTEECRVLVGKEWVQMGATTLEGCFKFADEAATPGERQFAKLGNTFLKVQGNQNYQSSDGGNTWEPVASAAPAAGFQSLNVLEPAQGDAAALASSEAPKKPVKKKRLRRYSDR